MEIGPEEIVEGTNRRRIVYFIVSTLLVALVVGYQSCSFWGLDAKLEKILRNISSSTSPHSWKEPTLLNLKRFKWIMNNASICKLKNSSKELRIMPILVHTARQHFQVRLAQRKSIGSFPRYKNWTIRLVFLLGDSDQSSSPQVNLQHLRDEQQKYGDIVMGSFTDSYRNLTYKHLMGYKWILNFCPEAAFVLKIDDDTFVDVFKWVDWRTAEFLEKKKKKPNPDLYCHRGRTGVSRGKGSKWYVTWKEWPNDLYPDYCSGWAYGITVELLQKLYSVSEDEKFFWVDDVYVTGALMEAAKRKYNFKPVVKELNGNVTMNEKEHRALCQNGSINAKPEIRPVAWLERGEFFERDLMCLWNKTLHDRNYMKGCKNCWDNNGTRTNKINNII